MPRVSVVIPAYNAADTIERAVESAVAQTVEDLEIIVVDDASTDNTPDIIAGFDDSRLEYVPHERNQGGSAARNTGVDHADGEYIAFLDADDEWLPDKLEYQLDTLQQRSNEWVAAHCRRKRDTDWTSQVGYVLARAVGTQKSDPPLEGGEELIKEVFLRNLSTGASTLLVDAEVLDEIGGFNPDFPRHQDWEFLIRILKRGKIAYIDEPLVVKHGTGRPPPAVYVEAKELLYAEFADEIAELEADGYPITHVQELHMAKVFFEEGEFRSGWDRLPLSGLTPPEYLSIAWSAALGLRKSITVWIGTDD